MQSRFSRVLLFMLAGPIIWAGHFLFIYSVNGIACARPALYSTWAGFSLSSWIIVAASLLALGGMAAIYLRWRQNMPHTGDSRFFSWLASALSLLSAVAIIWETMPVLMMPACS